jgi:hypothetical protein
MSAIGSRRYFFWLALGTIAYLVVEIFSLLYLYILREVKQVEYSPIRMSLSEKHKKIVEELFNDQTSYMQHDPDLGWSIKSKGYLPEYNAKANSDGIRADRDYQLAPPTGVLRIATFGDSYTHGDDVSNENTWQEFLTTFESNLEVLNFGVPGYGLDQAFLRYQKNGKRYQPHIVLIGFMTTDIFRHVNVFRPFYIPTTGIPLSKPRFFLRGDGIFLETNPLKDLSNYKLLLRKPKSVLRELGRHDWHYQLKPIESPLDVLPSVRFMRVLYQTRKRPGLRVTSDRAYDEDSDVFRLTLKIFDAFHENVMKHGAIPIIILFPRQYDLQRYRKTKTSVFTQLIRHFKERGYRHIDLLKAFDKYALTVPLEDLFVGHYSPSANKVIARYLSDYFIENHLLPNLGD